MARIGTGRVVLVFLVLSVVAILVSQWSPPAPAAPAAPAGCTSCHVPGKARPLDAALKTVKDHPALPAPTVATCVVCHKPEGRAAPLGPIMHRRHLAAAAFAGTYKGTCTSCHAVDLKTGRVTVVGLPPR